MNQEQGYQKIPIWFLIINLGLLVVGNWFINWPEQQERVKQWESEKNWVNTASCQELLGYIQIAIEQNPENSHFFLGKAKNLYEWKCEK